MKGPSHYKDWPNSLGFDATYEERNPVELQVEGSIPSYAAGTLFRTGLGPRTVQTLNGKEFKVNHWFDNFSQVHRFQIHASEAGSPVRVTYNSRLTSDGLIEKIRKTGKLDGFTFAAKYDPCKSLFRKVQSVFQQQPPQEPNEVNAAVTISANFPGLSRTGQQFNGPHSHDKILTLCNKTDANIFQMLDPETLEPVGLARQNTLHPELGGAGSGAHARSDPSNGDLFNYNLDFGHTGTYRVFRVSAATGKTSILGKFHHTAAYLHSLFLTENHVVLCVWNSTYKAGGASILWTQNLLDAMVWNDQHPATWFVIDKRPVEEGGKGLVAKYESAPFFCFHTINAYEEPSNLEDGSIDIVADLAAYEDMDVLHRFYLDNLISDSPKAAEYMKSLDPAVRPNYRRYRLPLVSAGTAHKSSTAVLEYESSKADALELPTINPRMVTQKHRYMYGIVDTGKSTFADGLVKHDAETHTVIRWSKHGHTAGEPIFVPDPRSSEEDGGVLLTVVLDGLAGQSYLLVLDAKMMIEVGRAHVNGALGFGFHGLHVSSGERVGRFNGLSV
ncbi:hypothetical protein LTR99_007363 [Exophiala xenobiotica]|uniref:Carotenoid oxygenase n=1 Tax=Vermiconidia calcicola TaxID=1690605 RepID=A0AAV9Q3I0_9PEZI|nr:hypothetical protein LTR96_008001 [Exophiala xenobiotica]KAK5534472.1 hypothetical protein LTR25_006504 [Vermiconidia calcicola]KAK5544646.1 hypothetical protein LTR23_004410 [Chaetothyriales sp. CCFEE 6169]KAK5299095.1 hypothetical protein LTR99_007363 [Exophiala xenobiotica]KAK5334781.1 hypothetical protein LTR98_009154 [Exophiala xenobiotica]